MTEPLSNWTLYRLLACLAIVIVPHFRQLPVWASVLVTVMIIWRGLVSVRHWRLPPVWLRAILAALAFTALLLSYGKINSRDAGAGILAVMIAFKLTEMEKMRDCTLVLMLSYFVLITHFLASQEIGTAVYVFAGAVLVTALLLEVSHPQGPLSPKVTLRSGAVMLMQAVPVMLAMFVLFPRIPGPLWGIPQAERVGRMGLSDSMEPGTLSKLSRSDEIAFRAAFLDPAPSRKDLYWRGPVLWHYDGLRWDAGSDFRGAAPAIETIGSAVRQEIILEPHNQKWYLALDLPVSGPPGSIQSSAHELMAANKIGERKLYRAVSYPRYQASEELDPHLRARALQLPRVGNARLRALAASWRKQGFDDQGVVSAALRMFHEEKFYYTLQPPMLSAASGMDDFLFNTRRGFCEHYAAAFTLLMRAADVPARVVTGYQGGKRNPASDYYTIRQSDAHAWSEAWIAGRGWVRVDPTAAVAPARIEGGLIAALPETDAGLVRRDSDVYLLYQFENYWELTNVLWNRAILAYGPELQKEFLSRFGIRDWYRMTVVLTAIIVLFLVVLGAVLLWQARATVLPDPALREWERFCRRLARRELARLPHEGPRDYAERVSRARPDLVADVARIAGLYIGLRYAGLDDPAAQQKLAENVKRFKP